MALEAYARALDLDASLSDAHLFRRAVYEFVGDDEEAARAYERVLAIDPTHATASEHLRGVRERLNGEKRCGLR